MTITLHTVAAELNVGLGHILDVVDAKITVDDSWSPYVQATLTCWTPDESVLDLLDPRDGVRVVVTVGKTFGDWNPSGIYTDQERVLNLVLRGRDVDHNAGQITLTLESDEALLQDFGLVATAPERIYGLSVKAAVVYALAKIGAVLAAGAADANVQNQVTDPVVTNVVANPSFQTNATGWVSSTGSATAARSTAMAGFAGNACLAVTATATAVIGFFPQSNAYFVPVVTGEEYTLSFYARASVAGQSAVATIRFATAAFASLGDTTGTAVPLSTTGWTRVTVTATAPATAAKMAGWGASSGTFTTGQILYIDAIMLTAGPTLFDYFDGSTADTGFIAYAWTGTADASASTRTYVPNSDAMIWQPGVTGWDYVEPLIQATGLRLFCNEARQWILQTSGTPTDGQINLAEGVNVTQGADTISRAKDWYDCVVVAYTRNEDADGKTITLYDAAGAPGSKMLRLEYDRAYPGPGAAQAVLDRSQGRGRVLALESISDYTSTPGMTLSATLPDSPIQVGVISSVTWSFPDDRMTIGSRGLTDTPPSSWLFAPAGRRWQDVAVGTDWTEYTP